MALDYNGFGLRCTTIFPDCVEQTIKFFSKKVVTGRPELPAYDSVPSGGTDIELPCGN
jgi:hypothetical protein